MYRIFASRWDNVLDALGASRLLSSFGRYREFWALRGIDLELAPGSRVGVIGRNGAGKSTLLKLITGNLAATEGTVEVGERVHALIEAGGGFHPDFTGRENAAAALTYQGLRPREIVDRIQEIAEFSELGDFLDQPYKTYSSGMQARLCFATATTIVGPKILVIDEILGAGDAYFLQKCNERMRELVSIGATVLLVSHSLDHILRMCDEALWVDRGRIIRRGPALEIVKAYQQYTRVLDERRLKAKNRKVRNATYNPLHLDVYEDTLLVAFKVEGGGSCDVSRVVLRRDGELIDELCVGHAQDAEPTHSAFVDLRTGTWGDPQRDETRNFRALSSRWKLPGLGQTAFALYAVHEDSGYTVEIDSRRWGRARAQARVTLNGHVLQEVELDGPPDEWSQSNIELRSIRRRPPGEEVVAEPAPAVAAAERRWPGEGSLLIDEVRLADADGGERTVFSVGSPLTLTLRFHSEERGTFPVTPTAVLYRLDGVLVSRYIGEESRLDLANGEERVATLSLPALRLGNGYYVFTVALYRMLDVHDPSTARYYDLMDRSYEFRVEGTPPLLDGVVVETAPWTIARRGAEEPTSGAAVPTESRRSL